MSVMRLMAGPFILLAPWAGATVPALAGCAHFTPFGQPVHRSLADQAGMILPPEWSVICHAGQVVAFNPEHNVSDWVAFRLRRDDQLNPKVSRKRAFGPDPDVPEEHRVIEDDYLNTGYDRGHLAPAGTRTRRRSRRLRRRRRGGVRRLQGRTPRTKTMEAQHGFRR